MSKNEVNNVFKWLNIKLIQEIEGQIRSNVSNRKYENKINAVKKYMLPVLKNLIEKYIENNLPMLARYQLGLSKFMDLYSFEWLDVSSLKNLKLLVKYIVYYGFMVSKQKPKTLIQTECILPGGKEQIWVSQEFFFKNTRNYKIIFPNKWPLP